MGEFFIGKNGSAGHHFLGKKTGFCLSPSKAHGWNSKMDGLVQDLRSFSGFFSRSFSGRKKFKGYSPIPFIQAPICLFGALWNFCRKKLSRPNRKRHNSWGGECCETSLFVMK